MKNINGYLHVKWHDNTNTTGRSSSEEEEHRFAAEEVGWEDSALDHGEPSVLLLCSEDDEENTRDDEQCDNLATVPCIDGSAVAERHNESDESTDDQDEANLVDFLLALHLRHTPSRVVPWNHERVDREKEGANE